MFIFIVKRLGFLKYVPLLPLVFDNLLKIRSLLIRPQLLDWIDDIEAEVMRWKGASVTIHKYGGTQFNMNGKEIGHIHGNGLADILLRKKVKDQLLPEGRITDHHTFKNSGWASFYIRTMDDKAYAIQLLQLATNVRAL